MAILTSSKRQDPRVLQRRSRSAAAAKRCCSPDCTDRETPPMRRGPTAYRSCRPRFVTTGVILLHWRSAGNKGRLRTGHLQPGANHFEVLILNESPPTASLIMFRPKLFHIVSELDLPCFIQSRKRNLSRPEVVAKELHYFTRRKGIVKQQEPPLHA